MEDALELGRAIALHGPTPEALRVYEAARWAQDHCPIIPHRYRNCLSTAPVRDACLAQEWSMRFMRWVGRRSASCGSEALMCCCDGCGDLVRELSKP